MTYCVIQICRTCLFTSESHIRISYTIDKLPEFPFITTVAVGYAKFVSLLISYPSSGKVSTAFALPHEAELSITPFDLPAQNVVQVQCIVRWRHVGQLLVDYLKHLVCFPSEILPNTVYPFLEITNHSALHKLLSVSSKMSRYYH